MEQRSENRHRQADIHMYQQRDNKAGADGEKRSGIKHDTGVTKKTYKSRNGNEDCTGVRYKGGGDYMNRQEKAIKWNMCHTIINAVRTAKGMELSKAKNPHRGAKEEKGK